jgi:hypothetical protein
MRSVGATLGDEILPCRFLSVIHDPDNKGVPRTTQGLHLGRSIPGVECPCPWWISQLMWRDRLGSDLALQQPLLPTRGFLSSSPLASSLRSSAHKRRAKMVILLGGHEGGSLECQR